METQTNTIKYWTITDGKKYLRYFYPNNNFYGSLKDMIGFSFNDFMIFSTKEEAEKKIENMFKDFNQMEGEIKLSFKLYKVLKKLKPMGIFK